MIFLFNGLLLFHAADCLAKLVAEAEKDADEEEVMTAAFIGPPDVRSHAVLNNDEKNKIQNGLGSTELPLHVLFCRSCVSSIFFAFVSVS